MRTGELLYAVVWEKYVHGCSRHRVQIKPDRQFSRDRQEYRKKSRGLQNKRKGRKSVPKDPKPQTPDPEMIKCRDGLF
jgi:hypothetical protein